MRLKLLVNNSKLTRWTINSTNIRNNHPNINLGYSSGNPTGKSGLLSQLRSNQLINSSRREYTSNNQPSNLSHLKGPHEPKLLKETIGETLDRQIKERGDKLAVISQEEGIKWTYKELGQMVDQLCHGLLKLGVKKGDRVGLYLPNCGIWLAFQYALAKLNVILVCLNPSYREYDLGPVLNLSELNYLITSESDKKNSYLNIIKDLIPELSQNQIETHWKSESYPHLKEIILISSNQQHPEQEQEKEKEQEQINSIIPFKSLLGNTSPYSTKNSSPDELINLQFTSGTTGTPKGVGLTHHNILNNGWFIANRQKLTDEDIVCVPVPLYHCFGLVIGNLACLCAGATLLYPAPHFSPKATLRAVTKYRATSLYGVPTMFSAILNHPQFKDFDITTLKKGVMAGSLCPPPLMERVINELGMSDVTNCYGMTETSPVSFMTSPNTSFINRTQTVGEIMPHTEAKIVMDGHQVPIGQIGNLYVRGYLVMDGYWNNSKANQESIKDGWMDTGDLAKFDSDGSCRIVGRSKDMIIRGGENLYPFEIESHFIRHPDIQDVSIVGVPHPHYGEVLTAFVIPSSPPSSSTHFLSSLRTHFQSRLATHKVPHHLILTPRFPTTLTGKIQKHKLREYAIHHLHLDQQEAPQDLVCNREIEGEKEEEATG